MKGNDPLTNQRPLLRQSQLPFNPGGGREVGEEGFSLQSGSRLAVSSEHLSGARALTVASSCVVLEGTRACLHPGQGHTSRAGEERRPTEPPLWHQAEGSDAEQQMRVRGSSRVYREEHVGAVVGSLQWDGERTHSTECSRTSEGSTSGS